MVKGRVGMRITITQDTRKKVPDKVLVGDAEEEEDDSNGNEEEEKEKDFMLGSSEEEDIGNKQDSVPL